VKVPVAILLQYVKISFLKYYLNKNIDRVYPQANLENKKRK
jgi:hypothetical protein